MARRGVTRHNGRPVLLPSYSLPAPRMFQSSSTRSPLLARLLPRSVGAIKLASVASLSVLLIVLVMVGLWSYRSDMRDAERGASDSARSFAAHIVRIVEAGNLLLLHQQDMANAINP